MAQLNNLKDEELVKSYLNQGNEQALEILVKRYLPLIYDFCQYYTKNNKDLSEDITQETFVKIWRNLKKFDTSKNLKAWIFSIAKNTALDWLKKKSSISFSLLENDVKMEFNQEVHEKLDQQNLARQLVLALDDIPESYNLIISLRYHQDLTFREISEFLEEPLNTVKSRYRRGLSLLKKLLDNSF